MMNIKNVGRSTAKDGQETMVLTVLSAPTAMNTGSVLIEII